jgi:preprotein translocase subunit SecE
MNNKKIKFYLFYILLSVIIFGAICGIVDNILDNIYLKKEFAFSISNRISLSTVSKAGTDYHYSFFFKENGTLAILIYHSVQMEQNILSNFIRQIQTETKRHI